MATRPGGLSALAGLKAKVDKLPPPSRSPFAHVRASGKDTKAKERGAALSCLQHGPCQRNLDKQRLWFLYALTEWFECSPRLKICFRSGIRPTEHSPCLLRGACSSRFRVARAAGGERECDLQVAQSTHDLVTVVCKRLYSLAKKSTSVCSIIFAANLGVLGRFTAAGHCVC